MHQEGPDLVKFIKQLLLYALIGISPIIPVAIASTIANHNGCRLHEGFSNPCIVFSIDIGGLLYFMGNLGWLGVVTIPLGGLLVFIVLVQLVVKFFKGNHSISRGKDA